MALDFKTKAFLPEQVKQEIYLAEKERFETINFEIEKTNRFLAILNNKVPNLLSDQKITSEKNSQIPDEKENNHFNVDM